MPVRNAMPFLDQAIESILCQTHQDFELVIGDDGSDDGSSERLLYWSERDPRIRLFRRETPSGPAASSNWVVECSRAALVARMDADDLSHPKRLEQQLAIFDRFPNMVLTGSVWIGIDSRNRWVRPPDLAALLDYRPFKAPFAHGSIMMRKSAFERVGGYRIACDYWEDSDFFERLTQIGTIKVSSRPLYFYRFSSASNRLHAEPTRIERQLALQLRCKQALAQREDYEPLVHATEALNLTPPLRVFQQRAGLQVWAGNRSNLILEWIKRKPRKSGAFDWPALVFLLWAAVSPRSLRWSLARMVSVRSRRARAQLSTDEIVDWG